MQYFGTNEFSDDLFQNPPPLFRGLPFWGWNASLDVNRLMRQIGYLKAMGFGGFIIHAREGLEIPYLGAEFMSLVRACIGRAKEEGMSVWLYDEDRWPSGSAGGLVTCQEEYRQRYLRITRTKQPGEAYAVFRVKLDGDGYLEEYHAGTEGGGEVWRAYLELADPEKRYNGYTNADVLNPKACDAFIRCTYEAYKQGVGDEFGRAVAAIFTDEPQLRRKTMLRTPHCGGDVILPWTERFDRVYMEQYGESPLQRLPELIWEIRGGVSQARYRYHNCICDLFINTYCGRIGFWCSENQICFTGHMHQEGELYSQTETCGDVMRAYPAFQIPGMDLLRDKLELTTAKQVQSIVHQYGRTAMMSELYGVTNWDFDFRGHKFQGDWQAALGVNVRVPHLAWLSMKGSAKRDYPASIHYQSPWFEEYSYIESHYARLHTALIQGKPVVRIGVIHPIESFWLYWGVEEQTAPERRQREAEFKSITEWLLFGLQDFDFINESLIETDESYTKNMEYAAILVPNCVTIRVATLRYLTEFEKAGGQVLYLGGYPSYIEAKAAAGPEFGGKRIPFERETLLREIESLRIVNIMVSEKQCGHFLYSLRETEREYWLFAAHGKKLLDCEKEKLTITVKGCYRPIRYDTVTGEISELPYRTCHGRTIIRHTLYQHDSLLIKLEKTGGDGALYEEKKSRPLDEEINLPCTASYRREEKNVLLLDMAEFCLDGVAYLGREEVLRIDRRCRETLGIWQADTKEIQPWCDKEDASPRHVVNLKFTIEAAAELSGIELAFENVSRVELNRVVVPIQSEGYYVDEDIHKIKLPNLKRGKNVLLAQVPFGKRNGVEAMYLLGEFGVKLDGMNAVLTDGVRLLEYGTLTKQGMPFYGGNIIYETFITAEHACIAEITVPEYSGAVIKLFVDGCDNGYIAFAPYTAETALEAGRHRLSFKLFGNRHNTFASLHNCSDDNYYGPSHWRAEGDAWSYNYQLRDFGILKKPIVRIRRLI